MHTWKVLNNGQKLLFIFWHNISCPQSRVFVSINVSSTRARLAFCESLASEYFSQIKRSGRHPLVSSYFYTIHHLKCNCLNFVWIAFTGRFPNLKYIYRRRAIFANMWNASSKLAEWRSFFTSFGNAYNLQMASGMNYFFVNI